MSIGILLLLFFVFLFLIMLASIWFVNYLTKQYIGKKHHDLDAITNQNRIPEHWSIRFEIKVKRLQRRGASQKKIAKVHQQANKDYTRKLDQLIQYAKKTRLVKDEETRIMLLNRLRKFRQQNGGWFNGAWPTDE